MSDDLVKRLRDRRVCSLAQNSCRNDWVCEQAADRIEELEAALPEQIEWVKRLADDLIAAEGREARLKEKLAKAVEAFEEIKRYSPCGDSRRKAIDTLAALKGQGDE